MQRPSIRRGRGSAIPFRSGGEALQNALYHGQYKGAVEHFTESSKKGFERGELKIVPSRSIGSGSTNFLERGLAQCQIPFHTALAV